MPDRRYPNEEPLTGSWREVWDLTIMVMGLLAGPMLVVTAGILLMLATLWAATTEPILMVIPIGIMAGCLWLIAERDKKAKAALEAEINGDVPARKV